MDQCRQSVRGVTVSATTTWSQSGRPGISAAQRQQHGDRARVRGRQEPLDPVVVRAEEDRAAASRASLLGLVIDPNQTPVGEAEVQLVGANMYGTTRSNGGFLFKPLDIGTYAVRVRKLGFAPTTATVQLLPNDDREIVIVLQPLGTQAASMTASTMASWRMLMGIGEASEPLGHRMAWIGRGTVSRRITAPAAMPSGEYTADSHTAVKPRLTVFKYHYLWDLPLVEG